MVATEFVISSVTVRCNDCVVRGDTYLDVYVIVLNEVTEEKSSIEGNDQLYFVAVVE